MKQAIVVRPEEEVCHSVNFDYLSAATSVLDSSLGPENRALGDTSSNLLYYFRKRRNANFEILQIGLAAGCWIWDYLRLSYQAGLFCTYIM